MTAHIHVHRWKLEEASGGYPTVLGICRDCLAERVFAVSYVGDATDLRASWRSRGRISAINRKARHPFKGAIE